MLSRILEAFEKAVGPLDLNELSHRLGVERSALLPSPGSSCCRFSTSSSETLRNAFRKSKNW